MGPPLKAAENSMGAQRGLTGAALLKWGRLEKQRKIRELIASPGSRVGTSMGPPLKAAENPPRRFDR